MADIRDKVNEAFENYLESYLSKKAREKIMAHYGGDVAARVKAIYDALKRAVDWRTATIDTALPVLPEILVSNYPWLSSRAGSNILGAFIIKWK